MKKLVSRSEFARLAGITPGAVTKACKKALAPATVGKRIDCDHPVAVEYLQRRDGAKTINGWTAKNTADKKDAIERLIAENGESYLGMTLSESLINFGKHPAFYDWVRSAKLIEDIETKKNSNAQTRGELVSRELVKSGIIDPINSAMQRLLTDGAKTMARRVTEMNTAGRSIEDCEKFIIDVISSFIHSAKSECTKRLQND